MKKYGITFLIAVLLSALIAGCAQSDQNGTVDADANDTPSAGIKVSYMHADWPYYESVDALTEAATNIFEGKITAIFFDMINIRTGQPDMQSNDPSSVMLHTIYEIEVDGSYKGENAATMYVSVIGGIKGYEEAEQYRLMETAGVFNADIGITVLDEPPMLKIGESYLFLTHDFGGKYSSVINVDQFAFKTDTPSEFESFDYEKIIANLKEKPTA